MTLPVILFLLAAVIPVFFGKIRSAPFWITLQALALGWSGAAAHKALAGHALIALLELLAVRALLAPWLLRRAIRRHGGPNLGSRGAVAVGMVAGIAWLVEYEQYPG